MSRTPEQAINSYITDMLALEDHIEKALRAQVADFKDEQGPERRPRRRSRERRGGGGEAGGLDRGRTGRRSHRPDPKREADVAERHLRDHAKAVMTLHDIMPVAVVKFLQQDELPAHADVLPAVARTLEDVWRSGSQEVVEVGGSRR